MKVKTSELTGASLNWVVASIEWPNDSGIRNPELMSKESVNEEYLFDKDWSLVGIILEREFINVAKWNTQSGWQASDQLCKVACNGPSAMIAILRCHVANRIGDEVEVPDHLL